MTYRQAVEESICELTNRKHCMLVGHGSTAVFLALKVIEQRVGRGEVILPTISCPSLAQVTCYAGFKPIFADVNSTDFTLDVDSFQSKINGQTRAVIPIHIFGHSAAMSEIIEAANKARVFVIEDAAQSFGGKYHGLPHGSFGQFSILSFGGSKIISAGSGGALLFDETEYALPILETLRELPTLRRSQRLSLMALSHRNLYHALVDLLRVDPGKRVSQLFQPALSGYRELYFHRFPEDEQVLVSIAGGLEHLQQNVSARFERAALYHDLLCSERLTHCANWKDSSVIWRYSLLVNDPQKLLHVTQQLRNHGMHASNHYWSVADLFYDEKTYSQTNFVCPRVLNLWVDENATKSYIVKSCDIILQSLN
jgi:dTDP-4-amino-4,6-dideoxygalactose transaminase